jgi:hypothetical protein
MLPPLKLTFGSGVTAKSVVKKQTADQCEDAFDF